MSLNAKLLTGRMILTGIGVGTIDSPYEADRNITHITARPGRRTTDYAPTSRRRSPATRARTRAPSEIAPAIRVVFDRTLTTPVLVLNAELGIPQEHTPGRERVFAKVEQNKVLLAATPPPPICRIGLPTVSSASSKRLAAR